MLLADVFRKFRNNRLKNYGLCPSHYLSTPFLNLDAKLKTTRIDLELIPDHDINILFENGTRGVISYISNRYSKANNKYLKYYDQKQESKHIIYLDANNFYSYETSNFFPTKGFEWIHPQEFYLNKYNSRVQKVLFSK